MSYSVLKPLPCLGRHSPLRASDLLVQFAAADGGNQHLGVVGQKIDSVMPAPGSLSAREAQKTGAAFRSMTTAGPAGYEQICPQNPGIVFQLDRSARRRPDQWDVTSGTAYRQVLHAAGRPAAEFMRLIAQCTRLPIRQDQLVLPDDPLEAQHVLAVEGFVRRQPVERPAGALGRRHAGQSLGVDEELSAEA